MKSLEESSLAEISAELDRRQRAASFMGFVLFWTEDRSDGRPRFELQGSGVPPRMMEKLNESIQRISFRAAPEPGTFHT